MDESPLPWCQKIALVNLGMRQAPRRRVVDIVDLVRSRRLVLVMLSEPLPRHHDRY